MSQHDNSQQDKAFVRNFSMVLGVLVVAAIGAYVLAGSVTGGKNTGQADAIKPISEVQIAKAETAKVESTVAAAPAEVAPAPAAEKPAEAVAEKPAEAATPATATPAAETPAPAAEEKPAETATPATEPPAEKPAAETAGAATTEQVTKLMADKGYTCMACHQVEVKVVGPAFKEVAAKYKGDAQAATALAGRIKAGGAGVWGSMPMPPNPTVTDEDMKTIVDWVLALQ